MGKVILAVVFLMVAAFCYYLMDLSPAVSTLLGVIVIGLLFCAVWAMVEAAHAELLGKDEDS